MIDCEAPAAGAFFAAAPGEGERQDTHPVAPPVILRAFRESSFAVMLEHTETVVRG